jgi:RNA-directed DNA polymerase
MTWPSAKPGGVTVMTEPRTPRRLRRQLRSAIHKLKTGGPLREGESVARLAGYAAFIDMTNPALGKKMLGELLGFGERPA